MNAYRQISTTLFVLSALTGCASTTGTVTAGYSTGGAVPASEHAQCEIPDQSVNPLVKHAVQATVGNVAYIAQSILRGAINVIAVPAPIHSDLDEHLRANRQLVLDLQSVIRQPEGRQSAQE
jgi:hypothetical protein